MERALKVTGIDLVKFIQKVYDLSKPQGLGFIHYKPEGLSIEEAQQFIQADGRIVISLDYVHGRACKMTVFREGDDLWIRDYWYDHSAAQFEELLKEFGIQPPKDTPAGWGTAA